MLTMARRLLTILKKASSYIAQYPVLRTAQSALHFTSLTDLFTQTPSRLLWEASSHMLQLMREGYSYTYPPLCIARYSFIQLGELEQCRVKKPAQGFNTAARIRTRVLIVESPKHYPWVTALYVLPKVPRVAGSASARFRPGLAGELPRGLHGMVHGASTDLF